MKIGLVLDDSLDRNDGVQQYVRSLGSWLASQGHVVHYLVGQSKSDDNKIHSLSRNIAVRFNHNRLTIPLPANTRAIKKLLNAQKYDVLHVQMPHSPFMSGKIVKHAPQPTAVVGTFHVVPFGRLQQYGSKALGLVQRRNLRRFDAICSVSSAAQAFAGAKFGIKSTVIPNMIDLSSWKTATTPRPGRVVFLGRLVPRKGCAELLAAVAALTSQIRSKCEIIIAGDGPDRQKLEKFVRARNLDNVTFWGFLAEKDKVDLLASAELAVFPSLGGESFGIVLIEAMAAGAGVVLGGNNIGYKTVLAPWQSTLFDPSSVPEFSNILEQFLTDDQLRKRTHAGQQEAVKRYDTPVVGGEILKLYQDVLLHRRGRT